MNTASANSERLSSYQTDQGEDLFVLLQLDGNDLLFSIAEYFNLHPVTSLEFLELVQKIVFVIHGLTRDAYDHITEGDPAIPDLSNAPQAGFRRARALRNISDHHASFDVQVASLLVTEIIDSQGGTLDLAEANELIDNPADRIHRNSEAYAGVTSAAADDGRVDPDQLTARIEQWAA